MHTEFNLAGLTVTIVEAGHSVIIGEATETVTEEEAVLYEGTLYCTQAQYDLIVRTLSPS